MGNSSSSGRGHHDESVDFGSLSPHGVYTGPRDWNQAIVTQLICARRLAPFYRPLEDYDENWDDDQILAARKQLPTSDPDGHETITRVETPASHTSAKPKRPGAPKEPSKPEALVYRGAVECPICFLYYPPNINHSRCCDQAICTECFVQIKRAEPTTTHLVSEPAACPYCVQENFGVVYTPPPWRAGLGSDGTPLAESSKGHQSPEPPSYPTHKRRQKSFGADSPEVVTTGIIYLNYSSRPSLLSDEILDQIRPDWETKLAAVRAAVARRANRRIIMRQVGDRLIPVGVTSGRVHALSPEEAAEADNGGSRRRRRGQPNQNFEQYVGMAGQDLEELMVMEAMRLSMIDHEEHQRKEAEEKRKQEAAEAAAAAAANTAPTSASAPGPSTLLELPSSDLTTPSPSTSAPPTSSPVHGDLSSVNKDAPSLPPIISTSSSLSRSRSPSPAPHNTINVALASSSTASAPLGGIPAGISHANGDASSTPPTVVEDATRRPVSGNSPLL
ncbi:hypothetical protein H0H92_011516 [Tricholoma furcatifolium]|nr:hypothetical protein H0H92_011516 [Tricholoma furcatifolium]